MPSFNHLTLALAASSAVMAVPVAQEKNKAFTVEQVQRGKYLKVGAEQMIRAYQKYGKPVPQKLKDAAATFHANNAFNIEADSGSVSAVPSDSVDSSYLCAVNVGGTTLNLDFDTGSADLWAFSSLQAASQRSGHDYYRAVASKKLQGYTWKISYGDGSGASGSVYADTVTVGGVTATSQAVEAAQSVSAEFSQDVNTDGLLGLAFSSINTVSPQPQTTFFDTVHDQLAQPLFAVTLKYHAAGTYDFGFIDTSKYTGSITYVDADSSQGFWGFSASGYSVGSTSRSGSFSGILDTGTTLMLLDDSIVNAYYSRVSGAQNDDSAGGYTFPCSASLPTFSITVGGVKQTVPGKFINFAPVQTGSSTCFGGIQSNSGIGFNIFGDIFLKSKYIVHEMSDSNNPRIGFAQQAGV